MLRLSFPVVYESGVLLCFRLFFSDFLDFVPAIFGRKCKARNYGLSSPSKNSLTIRPSSKYEPTKNGCYNNHVFGSDVHIYCLDDKSAEIFCTTTHEIAHSVHHFWDALKYYSPVGGIKNPFNINQY